MRTTSDPTANDDLHASTGGALLPGDPPQFRIFMSRSQPIDLGGIEWDAIRDSPLAPDILKIVTYMQDVESHTVVFPRRSSRNVRSKIRISVRF